MGLIYRTVASIFLVLAAFGTYAVTAVPIIDPQSKSTANPPPIPLPGAVKRRLDPHDRMFRWFGPDPRAWELNKPKIVQSPETILVFQEYFSDPEKLGSGKIRIEPLSMVFLSTDETLDPAERDRQAVILRVWDGTDEQGRPRPVGGILEFGKSFSLRRGNLGKLKKATLQGPIIIRSEGKSPGPEDDIRIDTRNVKITPTRIWTISDSETVVFWYGNNKVTARGLEIKLRPAEEAGSSLLGRVKSLTLLRDIKMNLVVKDRTGKGMKLSPASLSAAPFASGPRRVREFSPAQPIVVQRGAPVTVTCKGPLHFDGQKKVVTFHEDVIVVRQHPNGASDTLACDDLALYLQKRTETSDKQQPKASNHETPQLEFRRMVAHGNPAVLSAPGSAVYARGERLEYDLQTRGVSLTDKREVIFRQEANEIRAREIHYQPGPDGRLGVFRAVGAGWLNWVVRDFKKSALAGAPRSKTMEASRQPPRRFQAAWLQQLHMAPHEGRQVISLQGEAKAQVTGMGRLDADEIHVWLFEKPKVETTLVVAKDKAQKKKYDLILDRMLAQKSVVIDSPQLTGITERLEIFFHPPTASSPAEKTGTPIQGTATNAASQYGESSWPGTSAGRVKNASRPRHDLRKPSSQRFDVTGKRIQVHLVQKGSQLELSRLDIIGGARLLETKTAKPNEKPLRFLGDEIHVAQPKQNAARMTVHGQPGHVEGRGLTLTGAVVNLDQRTNKVWVEGPGVMTLLVDRDLNGKPQSQPRPLKINWQGSMHFDGQRAVFDQGVVVRHEHELLQTDTMEAILSQRVNFARMEQDDRKRPQIDRILCRGDALLERREFDDRGQTLHEKMGVNDLSIDQLSGAILANGPGWITRWSRKDAESEGELTGFMPRKAKYQAAAARDRAPRRDRPRPAAEKHDENGLNYLRVDFQIAMRGNLHEKVMVFSDQVQVVHVAVRDWGQTVNPDRIEQLGERGVVIRCDELHLAELHAPGGKKWMEVRALGNTVAEGQTFTAMASEIRYSQGKNLLVLNGTDRTPAELFRQQRVGGPRSHLAARKIEFWRQSNHIKINQAQFFDVSETPAPRHGRPKYPPKSGK